MSNVRIERRWNPDKHAGYASSRYAHVYDGDRHIGWFVRGHRGGVTADTNCFAPPSRSKCVASLREAIDWLQDNAALRDSESAQIGGAP